MEPRIASPRQQNGAEYPVALAYACFAVCDLATALAKELGTPERALFGGFDSGDLLCIGAVSPSGVCFSNDIESLKLPDTVSE